MGFGEIWGTDSASPRLSESADAARAKLVLEPPPGGTRFRYFMVAPEDRTVSPDQMRTLLDAGFELLEAGHCRPDTSRHPGMHRTNTLDYVTVLSGRLTLVLDEGEVELGPFDTVVQRGTNHAWINRGKEPALLTAVIIDAHHPS
jgi:mannose-6-phosphate isomerase-like protein (cupin superfamily)